MTLDTYLFLFFTLVPLLVGAFVGWVVGRATGRHQVQEELAFYSPRRSSPPKRENIRRALQARDASQRDVARRLPQEAGYKASKSVNLNSIVLPKSSTAVSRPKAKR